MSLATRALIVSFVVMLCLSTSVSVGVPEGRVPQVAVNVTAAEAAWDYDGDGVVSYWDCVMNLIDWFLWQGDIPFDD